MTIRALEPLKALDNALVVLEALARTREGVLGVTELAKLTGLNKTTVSRILLTLMQRGYVDQDPASTKYRLTLKLFELGSLCLERTDLVKEARPVLERLAQLSGEVVHLAVLDQGEAVYIDKVETEHAVRMYSRIGRRSPLHCTGVGKVLLAFAGPAEFERLVRERGLRRYTENTITDPEILAKHLAEIRQNEVAFDNEEHEQGIRCVAAPVRDHRAVTVAAISVAGPSLRLTPERQQQLVAPVKEAALEISRRLGYRPASAREAAG